MATRNNEKEWRPYKEQIRKLYLADNMTLQGLMDEMRSRGLDKTKAQYEYILKKWNFKKYQSAKDWAMIGRIVQERKREGKDSKVWYNGCHISTKRLRKEMNRYATSISKVPQEALSPILPARVLIRSPSPLCKAPEADNIGLSHLIAANTRLDAIDCAPLVTSPITVTSLPSSPSTLFYPNWDFSFLPLLEYLTQLHGNSQAVTFDLAADLSNCLTNDLRTMIFKHFCANKSQESHYSDVLASFLPNISCPSHLDLVQDEQDAALEFLKLTIMVASNSILTSNSDVSKVIYQWLKQAGQGKLLEYLMSMEGPTAEALVECVFRLAIDADDVAMTRRIINSGLGPNEILFDFLGDRITALSMKIRASAPCYELIKCLIEGGCRFGEKAVLSDNLLDGGCSQECFLSIIKSADVETTILLLKHAIHMNEWQLHLAASEGCVELIDMLFAEVANFDFGIPDAPSFLLLGVIESELPDETVLRILEDFVCARANTNTGIARLFYGPISGKSTGRGKTIIQFLLAYGAYADEGSLSAAVQQNRRDIVELFIEQGAPITARVLDEAMETASNDMIHLLLDVENTDTEKAQRSLDAFIGAISAGRQDFVKSFEDGMVQLPRSRSKQLLQALENATRHGHKHVFELLLNPTSANYSIVQDNLGDSLEIATLLMNREITEMLISAGLSFGVNQGFDALSTALRNRDSNLVRMLLEAGAQVNSLRIQDKFTTSVLPLATLWGDLSMVRELLAAGADVDGPVQFEIESPSNNQGVKFYYKTFTPSITIAAQQANYPMVDFLVAAGADIDCRASSEVTATPLKAAVRNQDWNMVKHLLSLGADPRDEGMLWEAVSTSEDFMQELLVTISTRILPCSKTTFLLPLKKATFLGNCPMIDLLLSAGANPNQIIRRSMNLQYNLNVPINDASCFGIAIQRSRDYGSEVVQLLLDRGADPNRLICDDPKETPLLMAIYWANLETIAMLIKHGAIVNTNTGCGLRRTPLQLAAEWGKFGVVKELLIHSADVNARPFDDHGATALQFAAIGGYLGTVKLLLDNGADVNAPPAKLGGRTALEAAAEHGRLDIVQLLINAGASVTIQGQQQYERAASMAKSNGHMAVFRLLEKYQTWNKLFQEEFPV